MNKSVINKPKTTLLLCLLSVFTALGQQKTKQTFTVNNDVIIDLNTSHTNIKFETWNKNKVEVEAFIESDALSQKELDELFNSWNLSILGTNEKVKISTG